MRGEAAMQTYVALVNWTAEGLADFRNSVEKYEAAVEEFAEFDVRFLDHYWTLGEHDMVAVVEAPDDESLAAAVLRAGAGGNIRTRTMRAFSRHEMRGVIDKAS
jgi:uncharacterized protein with GYD domain